MNISQLHTKIDDKKRINDITIIRESPDSYPKGKSNIYAVNDFGYIIWFAELPITGDTYINSIQWNKDININSNNWNSFYKNDPNSFVVSSWNCFTVSINYKTGRIKNKVFTK